MKVTMKPLVKRKRIKIVRDTSRVITRLLLPEDRTRVSRIIDRVLSLTEQEAGDLMDQIKLNFFSRHEDVERTLESNYEKALEFAPHPESLSEIRKLLIGAYFTMEYSIESAALFNPSIVPHPDQSNIPLGDLRFIMSLRATGEGHISSIVFRSGIIEKGDALVFAGVSEFIETPAIEHDLFYDRHLFHLKLVELNAWNETSIRVLDQLPERFHFYGLKKSVEALVAGTDFKGDSDTIKTILWLADSNYMLRFRPDRRISERVIFPVSLNESRGIEDARFVRFVDDNGDVTYYATYTAYNGFNILPQLIETKDFITFNIVTLNGKAVQNKGMALFPRKINGKYAMLSRQDGENNRIMFSDHPHFWKESKILQEPVMPWEFVQIGNCGSPLETTGGWLVLTHGVGAMRRYSIGAMLLDKENPEKVIARLEEPLLAPQEEEREGYVPNVVYSCGSLIHNGKLVIPYAMSDTSSGIATVDVGELISCMQPMPLVKQV